MNTYTERLKREIERVTLKGNADKETLRVLSSIIFDMDMRITELQSATKPAVVEAPAIPQPVEEQVKEEPPKSARRATKSKSEE